MRQNYSLVRFNEKTVLPSNALARDVKASPSVSVYRDSEDYSTIVVEVNGVVNDYPWAQVSFARRVKADETKKGKG